MAEKKSIFMQLSEITSMKMAVIEYREAGGHEWREWSKYYNIQELEENYLRERCEKLANKNHGCEFRLRYGWLTLEPSDNCEIFKSE